MYVTVCQARAYDVLPVMKPASSLFLALFLASCGGDGPSAGGAGSGGAGAGGAGAIGCASDTRAMTYSANMELPSKDGRLKLVLQSSDPAPPVKGNNNWVLRVLDAAGAPVTGATLTVVPKMPDHGHGTSIVPTITPMGDTYRVDNVNLFMAGLWEVTITVSAGANSDFGVFSFCIAG